MSDIPEVTFKKKADSNIGFEIFKISSLFARFRKSDSHLYKAHRVGFHVVCLITKGSGKHFIDFKAFDIKEGDLFFVAKGQVHAFQANSDYEAYMIMFTDDFVSKNLINSDFVSLNRLYNYHLGTPVIEPNKVGIKVFTAFTEEIYKEYGYSENFAKEEILSLLLRVLLLKAERIKKTLHPLEKRSGIFAKFGELQRCLETNVGERRDAQFYADELGVSYKHLNEVCKGATGLTAKEFIVKHLILEIKRLLVSSTDSIKELAYKLNFEEPTNFVKFFKKHAGESPAQFRKNQVSFE